MVSLKFTSKEMHRFIKMLLCCTQSMCYCHNAKFGHFFQLHPVCTLPVNFVNGIIIYVVLCINFGTE